MCSDRTEPRNLRQILNRHPRTGGGILERTQLLVDINRALRDWCDEPWVSQVRVANIRSDTVVLYASSAPALLRLRQRGRSLLAWLNARYPLSCTRIESKVRPPATRATAGV